MSYAKQIKLYTCGTQNVTYSSQHLKQPNEPGWIVIWAGLILQLLARAEAAVQCSKLYLIDLLIDLLLSHFLIDLLIHLLLLYYLINLLINLLLLYYLVNLLILLWIILFL